VAEAVPPALALADSLLGAGHADQALNLIEDLERRWGDDPLFGSQISEWRGVALLAVGRTDEALPLLEEAVARRPMSAGTHRNLALALAALGRRGRALAEYAQAAELAPRDAGHRLDHAHYLAEFGLWDGAAEEYRAASYLCDRCPAAERGWAVALLRAGRPDEALAPLLRLHRPAGDFEDLSLLVTAAQAAGRDSLLLAVLAGEPTARRDRGMFHAEVQAEGRLVGRPPSCSLAHVRELEAGRTPSPVAADPLFWGRVSLNLLEANEDAAGLVAADRAIELDPGNAVFRNNRVVLLTRLGRHEEARLEWERVLLLDPSLKDQTSP